jgi:outer membrane protein TolC
MKNRGKRRGSYAGCLLLVILVAMSLHAQNEPQVSLSAQTGGDPQNSSAAPLTLTIADALQRARAYNIEFQTAMVEAGVARQEKTAARAALLPSVKYNGQYLYTEGNGTLSGVYIANNGVHEYISQGNAHQDIGLGPLAEYSRASAAEALARAKAEIATRGLVATVVQKYYGLIAAERKYASAQAAAAEAQRFLKISQDLERGGEVAHSDVIKAQLQFNDRQNSLLEAQLNMRKARLDLAVLLFPNFNQNFTVIDDLATLLPLPSREEVQQLAAKNNPNLRAATAALQVSTSAVSAAEAKFLPTLALDYWYGIDANRFATRGIDFTTRARINNLGYSAAATLTLPVWDWGATRSAVRKAKLQRSLAHLQLTAAQKQAIANLQEFYDEAETARTEFETLRNSADLAAESLRLTSLRYQAGESTVLEVVDAQNTLTTAQNNLADGQVRYRVALATLQTLTGNF